MSLAPLLCLHTLGIEGHHVLISRGVMDFEFSLPLDGNYFIGLTPPLLMQQPSQLRPQTTSSSQLATMPFQLGVVPVPLVTKPTKYASTKSSSPPPKNNVNSPPMSFHILAHL